MRFLLLAVALLAPMAGCLEHDLHLPVLEVDERFTWTGQPVARLQEGGHCREEEWSGSGLLLYRSDSTPLAVIVRHYHPRDARSSQLSFSGPMGGDQQTAIAYDVADGDETEVGRSFAEGPFFTVRWAGGQMLVDGEPVVSGSPVERSVTYAVDGGTVTETATLRFRPRMDVAIDSSERLCM